MHSRLEDVVPLLGISGAHFINLQVGETAEELNRARDEFGATLHDFGDLDIKNDLDETTALIAALDSIVTPRGWVTCFAGLVGVQTYCFSAAYCRVRTAFSLRPMFKYSRRTGETGETINGDRWTFESRRMQTSDILVNPGIIALAAFDGRCRVTLSGDVFLLKIYP